MPFRKIYGMSFRQWLEVVKAENFFKRLKYAKVVKRACTIQDRIRMTPALWDYFNNLTELYGKMFRRTWHLIQSKEFRGGKNKVRLNQTLQQDYGVSKRTANSVINDAEGRLNAATESKKLNIADLKRKIGVVEKKVARLRESVNRKKKDAIYNRLTEKELKKYRKEKFSLHQKTQKLDRMTSKLHKLETKKKVTMCFGTKKLYDARLHPGESGFESHGHWLRTFREKRDHRAFFLGAADENCGNQRAQLQYDPEKRTFTLYVRKEYCLGGEGRSGSKDKDAKQWIRIGGGAAFSSWEK